MHKILVLSKRNQLIDMLFLMLIFVISIVIVNPLGDFPLIDDWSFARAVKGLVEHGDWRPIGWTGMSLITQSLWGALFCVPAGFSFNALRLSTLTLAAAGILGVYVLFITNNRSRLLAVTAALTLGFNPIYYELSNTFMTDVPFTTLAIFSSMFFIRCIRRFRYLDLSIACALAVATTLCRQLGLFLPLAFAVALVVQHGFAIRWLARAILPSMVCVAALMLFQHWMSNTGRMPALYGTLGNLGSLSITGVGFRIGMALLYLGLFCLPILLLGYRNPWLITNSAILRRLPALSGGLFTLISIYFIFGPLAYGHAPRLMPPTVGGNILMPPGFGPRMLRGSVEPLPFSFWGIVTVLSVVGGVLLVRRIAATSVVVIEKMRISDTSEEDTIWIFCLTAVGACALPMLVRELFFDRHLLPLVPFLLYMNASETPREGIEATIRKCASAVLIAFVVAFAVLGTRDYLTWNRVRWAALAELQQTANVSAHDIDGGFEYNGWFLYDPAYQESANKSWWWVDNDKYLIASSKIKGFKVIKAYEYFNLMPPEIRTLLLLKRHTGN